LKLRKPYNYFYWRCYDLLSLTGNYDLPWGASHFLSLILGVTTFRILLEYFKHSYKNFAGITGLSIFLLLELLNYFLFLRKDKYLEIQSEYKNEPRKTKRFARVVFILLLVGGIYSLF